jgi:rhodanese-related sulfurtransferase
MADIERISAQQAHTKAKSNQGLLVCAYEDETKCRMLNLDGSISFASFKSRVNSLPKSQEIIFYWAWPAEASAVGQAAKYQSQGFTNVKVLKGGVEGWKAAGYAMNWSMHAARFCTEASRFEGMLSVWVHHFSQVRLGLFERKFSFLRVLLELFLDKFQVKSGYVEPMLAPNTFLAIHIAPSSRLPPCVGFYTQRPTMSSQSGAKYLRLPSGALSPVVLDEFQPNRERIAKERANVSRRLQVLLLFLFLRSETFWQLNSHL